MVFDVNRYALAPRGEPTNTSFPREANANPNCSRERCVGFAKVHSKSPVAPSNKYAAPVSTIV